MALLDTTTKAVVLVSTLLFIYVVQKTIAYSKLSQFPGPRWTGISGIPHRTAMFGYAVHEWYHQVSEKYGASW
jgi:hypothetical protein